MKSGLIVFWIFWGVFLIVQILRRKPWVDLLTLLIISALFFVGLAHLGVPGWIALTSVLIVHAVCFAVIFHRHWKAARA